jgi:erythromycin esterase
MRATAKVVPVFVFLSACVAVADDAKPAEALAQERVAWLKKHAASVRSLDPADEDFADLEPIRKAIGESRIVFLGEEWHGSGATFRARSRVIKFLHQKCGFDVLAFESGLYDCRKTWEFLVEGKMPAGDAARQGIFQTWSGTEECRPMWDYLGKQARQPRPLEVCGFDCQFTGVASRRFLPGELSALFKKLPHDALAADVRVTVAKAFAKLLKTGTGIDKQETEAIAACHKALKDAKPSGDLPEKELRFWRQFLESVLGMAEVEAAYKAGYKDARNYNALRDVHMARNLVWLAHEMYPKRKIMVWAATYHLMRNPYGVNIVVEPGKTPAERKTAVAYPQERVRTMAHEAWSRIEKETYSIFFSAAEGEFQSLTMAKPQKMNPMIPGSLEDLLLKAGYENGFVDLRQRGAGGKWLEERLVARILGDMDYEADWTKVCDGVFFLRKQHGVNPVKLDVAVKYHPTKETAALGVPFDRYTTRDALGRTITFYLSHGPKEGDKQLPLAVFVQGSGCASVFSERDGKTYGGLQNLLLASGKGRCRVLVVEKPGVAFGAVCKNPGSAEEGSAAFRREHTLSRWVEAVNAAVRAAHRLEDIDWKRTLIVGHSEGGIVAAHVAATNSLVSHVAVLAGGGPTQLFDLIELAGERGDAIRAGWAKVLEDPDNADKLWLGHPHRRWCSFLRSSTLEGLGQSRAAVFAAQGTLDKAVAVSGFDVLCSELSARGRDLVSLRLEGRDHGFRKADDKAGDPSGIQDVFGRVVTWFQEKQSPVELALKRELERMNGTWRMLAMNQDGEPAALEGTLANLQVIVQDDRRTLRSGDNVLAQAHYRLNPSAQPATIDIIVAQGAARGQTLLGIYEINEDRLRVCYAAHGRDRPQDFNPKAGSGQTLQELKRMPQ